MNATEAIELTVEARIKELETGKWSGCFDDCPLCNHGNSGCRECPIMVLTGDYCPDESRYHHDDPEMGVSFALALQYY